MFNCNDAIREDPGSCAQTTKRGVRRLGHARGDGRESLGRFVQQRLRLASPSVQAALNLGLERRERRVGAADGRACFGGPRGCFRDVAARAVLPP